VLDAFFLPVEPGRRFCVLNTPPGGIRPHRCVVYLHPFAEEMHKSRRMAALQARRLAADGFAVLQIDLHGCGDSTGEFAEARWDAWKRDARAAAVWLSQRYEVPLTFWGLRLGALLAADVAQDPGLAIDRLLLWQPVTDGNQFLSQFLRLRLASEMLVSGAATSAIRGLTEALHRGESPEIAGYELHPDLAAVMAQVKLEALTPAVKQVDWLEVVSEPGVPFRPASRRVLDGWSGRGLQTSLLQAVGEPFWSTIEITECEQLLHFTAAALRSTP
jgi:exosortase A-associated hydrolase 2